MCNHLLSGGGTCADACTCASTSIKCGNFKRGVSCCKGKNKLSQSQLNELLANQMIGTRYSSSVNTRCRLVGGFKEKNHAFSTAITPALGGLKSRKRIVVWDLRSRRQQQTCCHTINTMRPLILGFILVATALAFLVLAQQTLIYNTKQGGLAKSDRSHSSGSSDDVISSNFLIGKLARPSIQLNNTPSYYEESHELGGGGGQMNGGKFQRNGRGHLNFRRASANSSSRSIQSVPSATEMPAAPQPSNGTTGSRAVHRNSNNDTNKLQGQLTTSAENVDAITIDKIKGLDWSGSRMSFDKPASRQKNNQRQANYENRHIKCNNNKYDRLIAQKISLNDLSRPNITSSGRFENPFPTWKSPSFIDAIQFMVFEPDESGVPKNKDELDKELPIIQPDFHVKEVEQNDFRVTWIGHSTLLIQVDGFNILTDPIFSDRASPMQFVGPKRIRDPACKVESLPRVDIVLISHNHYDHLDENSVKQLNDRFGNECRWIVPLGVGEFMQSMSVENYVELDWWQKDCFHAGNVQLPNNNKLNDSPKSHYTNRASASRNNSTSSLSSASESGSTTSSSKATRTSRLELDIYLTPAQHWSRRGINDIMKSLWGSYTIVSGNGSTFFFAGDTGYCSAFKEIGKIFGPFTGAAIPIGAYKPRWFLKPSHVNPEEAVQIHKDLHSMKSIAIHHSTFTLSNENYREPIQYLKEAMRGFDGSKNDTVKEPFISLKHGESTNFCKNSC